jgi:chromosome segregation ATPase
LRRVTAERDALQQQKKQLAALQAELDKLRAELEAAMKELADLKQKLAALEAELKKILAERDALLQELADWKKAQEAGEGELETALREKREAEEGWDKERALREVLEQAIDKALVSHRGDLGKDFGDLAAKKNEFDGSYMGKQQGLAERVATDLGDLLAAAKEERDGRLTLETELGELVDKLLQVGDP